MTEPELIEAEAAYLEGMADKLRQRAREIRELGRGSGTAQLETELERLPWKEAASKKCDYVKDAPSKLVEAVRFTKGGVKGKDHHFTAATDAPTLFRFKRSGKA